MNTLQKYEKRLYLLFLIGIIVYLPIFFNGFVWDDYPFILNNPQVHQFNFQALFGPGIFNNGPFYRPLPAVYFAIIYHLSNTHAILYHLIQLLLHLVNSSLLFVLFCLFFSENISFFLALIFLVHPIKVESVAYIGSTQSELYFLPGIIAFLLASNKKVKSNRLVAITVLLCFTIFTKETGFLFIPLILLYRYLFKLGKLKEFLISGVGIVVFYLLIRLFIGNVTFNEAYYIPIASLPLLTRLINIPSILIYYIQTFFFPITLTIWQSWIVTTLTPMKFFIPLLFCLIIAGLITAEGIFLFKEDKKIPYKTHESSSKNHNNYAIATARRYPIYLFFLVWLILGMGMLLQIVPLDMTVADRWFYFPIVGLLGIIGAILEFFTATKKQNYRSYLAIAIIIISIFSFRTFNRTFDWKNNLTIYADASHQNNNYMLDSSYAFELYNSGKHDDAIQYDKRSINTFPTLQNVALLGAIYQKSGLCDKAIPLFTQSLILYKPLPDQGNVSGIISQDDNTLNKIYLYLTDCYIQENQPQDAINLLTNQALKKFPDEGLFYISLAFVYSENNEQQQAVNAITKAYALDPTPEVKQIYDRFRSNYIPIIPTNPGPDSESNNPSLQNQTQIINPQILPQQTMM